MYFVLGINSSPSTSLSSKHTNSEILPLLESVCTSFEGNNDSKEANEAQYHARV